LSTTLVKCCACGADRAEKYTITWNKWCNFKNQEVGNIFKFLIVSFTINTTTYLRKIPEENICYKVIPPGWTGTKRQYEQMRAFLPDCSHNLHSHPHPHWTIEKSTEINRQNLSFLQKPNCHWIINQIIMILYCEPPYK
jgi:hypothetical protein